MYTAAKIWAQSTYKYKFIGVYEGRVTSAADSRIYVCII